MPERPRSIPVRRDQIVDLRVETFGDGPDGLCRIDGYVLFVPFAVPGELVRARVTSAARKFGRAELLEVLEASPERVVPRCPHFGLCGGCQFQHVEQAAQLRAKVERLRSTLAHALRIEPSQVPMRPPRAPADGYGQRTKLALHFEERGGSLVAGYFARRSRELVPIEVCPAQQSHGLQVALAARDGAIAAGLRGFDPRTGGGQVRAVVVRSAAATGDAHAMLVVTSRPRPSLQPVIDALRAAGATGASLCVHDGPPERLTGDELRPLFGARFVEDEVGGIRYRCSAGAFFQTSAFGVEALVAVVREALADAPSDARIADLYCGGGLLGLAVADRVGKVFGIEDDERAIADAEATAAAAGIGNARFRAGRVEHLISNLARQRDKPFAAILDPPRSGCDPAVLARLTNKLQPKRVIYVSCEPSSLAHDLARLCRQAHALRAVVPIDMFPHTAHVESVAILERTIRRTDPVKERLLAKLRDEAARGQP